MAVMTVRPPRYLPPRDASVWLSLRLVSNVMPGFHIQRRGADAFEHKQDAADPVKRGCSRSATTKQSTVSHATVDTVNTSRSEVKLLSAFPQI